MINKQAIIFDLDGTLIDTKELILASFRFATQEVLGEPVADERILPLIGIPLIDQMLFLSPEHADELMMVYREHNAQVYDELIQYFEGTREMLEALKVQKKRLAVVTSKRNEPALQGLQCYGLQDYFEIIVGMEDTEKHKPDPQPLLYAMKKMQLLPETCVYVGDSPYDMRAACAAGITAIAALWGMFTRKELLEAGAEFEATNPLGLLDLLKTLNF